MPEYLAQALQGLCASCDGVARRLRLEFGADAIRLPRVPPRRMH